MASTNKTTHYELSQYIGTDKPTYLVDYNQDMGKIDAGIYGAKSEADTNASAIGTLSNLNTSVKTDLVSAVNEVEGETASIGTLSNLTTTVKTDLVSAINEVDGVADGIGTLANLTTTAKSNVVSAVNEVNANVGDLTSLTTTTKSSTVGAVNELDSDIGNLSTLTTTDKSSVVGAINDVKRNVDNFNLTIFETATNLSTNIGTVDTSQSSVKVAKNSDGSLAKIYGRVRTTFSSNSGAYKVSFKTTLRPSSNITINCMVINRTLTSSTWMFVSDLTIETDGTCTTGEINVGTSTTTGDFWILPCLLFIKDFGDVPLPE